SAHAEKGDGTLTIVVKPWAEVTIDGASAGFTPVTRKLPAGRHKVRLKNSELNRTDSATVTIHPGKTERISRDWEK
ncbi:MAG TPA: PEGA domain-containing protein, partial [Kofleriaceae bacterium]|nr:PEGA domain-containing protein [Kofleriaceae bacterium]